jgi:integrase
MGTVYKRGKTYWIKYHQNGKAFYESTKSTKWANAANLLKQREGDAASGKPAGVRFDKVMFAELVGDFKEDYRLKGQHRPRVGNLEAFFEGMRVVDVTTAKIKSYINHRQEQGAANATINRDLAALKRMLNLGAKETPPKVNRVPYIPMLKENNAKEGFFEDSDYAALLKELPEYIQGIVQFAYWTGWREAQIRNITWKMVKIKDRLITAPGRITKNSKPHTVYMNDPLLKIIKERRSNRNLGCPYVFHRNGQQVKDFRSVWNTACRGACLGYGYRLSSKYVEKWEKEYKPGPTIHDFRRTATRNLIRSGVSENVAMKITGHKTRSVFDRYNIVTPDDLKLAAEKQAKSINGKL